MDLSCIPDDWWVEYGPSMFRTIVGDDTDWALIQDHWRGMTLDAMAEKYDEPRSTIHRWITQAMMRLRRAGFPVDELRRTASQSQRASAGSF